MHLGKKSAVDDLLSLSTGTDASGVVTDPWACLSSNGSAGPLHGAVGGAPASFPSLRSDPWNSSSSSATDTAPAPNDPWSVSPAARDSLPNDPWQPSPPPNHLSRTPLTDADAWLCSEDRTVSGVAPSYGSSSRSPDTSSETAIRKTPESFLGPNSNLVNLDALVSAKSSGGLSTGGNPFAGTSITGMTANPFQAAKPAAPTINQLRSQGSFPATAAASAAPGQVFAATGGGFVPTAFPTPDLQSSGSSFSIPSGNNPFSM